MIADERPRDKIRAQEGRRHRGPAHASQHRGSRACDQRGPATLLRWVKDPEFDAAYREARRLAFRQSVARLQQASSDAVSTLLKIMVDPNAPASTRVRAADSILDHSAKAIELEDVEARVTELERAAEAQKRQ